LELAGKEVTAEWVLSEVEKDRMFYERSGGGITLSGGEPLAQPDFATEILRLARRAQLHTALDTSGLASEPVFDRVTRLADLVLFDIKAIDEALHRKLTGVSNTLILANLGKLLERENAPAVWFRLPIIPGQNDSDDAIGAMVDFCASVWGNPRLQAIHLMPYHRLAESKYQEFGKEYTLNGLTPPSENDISGIIARFEQRGIPVARS
jgi:pyruvate formate lyase activating enzyme